MELTTEQQQRLTELNAAIDAAAELGDGEFFDAVAAKDDYLESIGHSECEGEQGRAIYMASEAT